MKTKHRKTRAARLLAAALLLALILAGCGGKTAPQETAGASGGAQAGPKDETGGSTAAEGTTGGQAPQQEPEQASGQADGGAETPKGPGPAPSQGNSQNSGSAGETPAPSTGPEEGTPAQGTESGQTAPEQNKGSADGSDAGGQNEEAAEDPQETPVNSFTAGSQSRYSMTYTYSGQTVERICEYYIPSGFTQGRPLPLMLTLHGSGSTGAEQMADGDFVRLAEREGFVAIAPNAVGISSDNRLYGDGRGMRALGQSNPANLRWHAASSDPIDGFDVNDTAYLCDLIDAFVAAGVVDPHRVYVSGLSHGAFMSIRMALEAPERVAGIAPVAGELCSEYEGLSPRSAVKMVFIQGDNDWVVPIEGMIYGSYVWAYSTDDTIAWFLERYGYPVQITDTRALADTVPGDGCTVTRYSYTDGAGVERAVKYVVSNGGHNWPGGKLELGMEPYCKDVLATELIWNDLKDVRK